MRIGANQCKNSSNVHTHMHLQSGNVTNLDCVFAVCMSHYPNDDLYMTMQSFCTLFGQSCSSLQAIISGPFWVNLGRSGGHSGPCLFDEVLCNMTIL